MVIETCESCGKTFKQRCDYNRHRKTHDRPYGCKLCSRKFALKNNLSRHENIHEIDKRKFKCKWPMCDYPGTTRYEYLLNHMRKTHTQYSGEAKMLPFIERTLRNLQTDSSKILQIEAPRRKLLDAVAVGDYDRLQQLLLLHPELSVTEANEIIQAALVIAYERGDKRSIRILVTLGVNTDLKVLVEAVKSGDSAMVDCLLGADLNLRDDYDSVTLLNAAVERGDFTMVACLIKRGADVNASSPLHTAIRNNYSTMVEYLVKCGANPHFASKYDPLTPLLFAIEIGDVTVMESLLRLGVDPNSPHSPKYPLLYAIALDDYIWRKVDDEYIWRKVDDEYISRQVEVLLKYDANPNCVGRYSFFSVHETTPLRLAKNKGYSKTVEVLLKFGATPDG